MNQRNFSEQNGINSFCLVALAMFAAIFPAAQAAQAAEWSIDADFRVGYEFDSNATLAVRSDPFEIEGYILQGSATFAIATDRTTFDVTPLIRSRNYEDVSFDSDDGFVDFDFSHSGGKNHFRIRGTYSDESTRTAERADAKSNIYDPDEIPDDGETVTFASAIVNRERIWFLPQWSYDLSDKWKIAASATYLDVDYGRFPPAVFRSFADSRVEASLSWEFWPAFILDLGASARRYEPEVDRPSIPFELEGQAYTVGLQWDIAESTRFRAEVGEEESKPLDRESSTDDIWDIYLVSTLKTLTLLAQVKRSIGATGGESIIARRDSYNLNVTKQFSDRFSVGMGVRAFSIRDLDNFRVGREQDYYQIQAQFMYELFRNFSVGLEYRYSHVEREFVPVSAISNSAIIFLSWHPNIIDKSP